MTDIKPPLVAELVWDRELRFGATAGSVAIVIDGDGVAGPSPMQLAAFGIAGCMAIDVISMLQKGRQPVSVFRVSFSGVRAPEPPRRFLSIDIRFHVTGPVSSSTLDRAIALSREKYCSVWHSMRQDIDLTTSVDIHR